MKKIVLDTNVIVSAQIGNSYPRQVVFDYVLSKKVEILLSNAIFQEYVEVLRRPKFYQYPHFITKAEIVLNKLDELAFLPITNLKLSIIRDEPDNRFLELAVSGVADFLITGNNRDFLLRSYESVKIVSPEEFVIQMQQPE
jgi:putative PIN family toxin of toxin-antitoxin system